MSTLQEYISVIGMLQGCLLFFLLTADRRVTRASRILGFSCLLIALSFLAPFLKVNVDKSVVQWTIGWLFCLSAISGAVNYFYCRSALTDKPWTSRDLVHFTPLVLCCMLVADFLFVNPQEFASWIAGFYSSNWRLSATEYVIVGQAFVYSVWTLSMILRHRREAHNNLANFNADLFRWLVMLQIFTMVVWGLVAVPGLASVMPILADIANLVLVVFVYLIAIMQWRNPQLFLIEQRAPAEPIAPKKSAQNSLEQDGELDQTTRAELFDAIKKQIENDQIFLDGQLTLSSLAVATGLSKHHLSEVLNRHAGKNFYEFINNYRVDFVRKRLADDSDKKILDIALEAGFSSKSTFNAIFKRFTGQTPTQYRKELQQKED